jgi:hypothetical protein
VTLPRNDERKRLLPVFGEDLVAGFGEPGAVLLQTGQHGLIAIIDHRPAKSGDVARAGVVSCLLRSGTGGKKGHDDEKPDHPLGVLNQFTTDPVLAHDPEKCEAVFRKDHAQNNLKRDSDST